jgi:hypothetical protein
MSKKDKFINVDHPEFEVHNFHSLAELVGYSPTGLQDLYARHEFKMIATNFYKSKNMFAITKEEIDKLREKRRFASHAQPRIYFRDLGNENK